MEDTDDKAIPGKGDVTKARCDALALLVLMLVTMTFAVRRFRRTLD